VITANRTWVSGASTNVVVEKYESAGGLPLWTSGFDGSGHGANDLRIMRLDADGNPIVAGATSSNLMVLKFDGKTGDLAWASEWDGPASGYDVANDVAIVPTGGLVATGFCTADGTSWDVATIRIRSDDGAVQWAVTFDGGEASADEGRVVAVTALGDVYAGGYSYDSATGMDLLAVRYSDVSAVGVADAGAWSLARLRTVPNPIRPSTPFGLAVDRAGRDARVLVIDIRGRLVRTIALGRVAPGIVSVGWDGRDDRASSCRAAPTGCGASMEPECWPTRERSSCGESGRPRTPRSRLNIAVPETDTGWVAETLVRKRAARNGRSVALCFASHEPIGVPR
jgi:hypothetical protein